MTTLLDIVTGCENQLGWQPEMEPGQYMWQVRIREVNKLKRAINSKRLARKATVPNLVLALEYSRRRRLPVHSPIALLHRIDAALAVAYQSPVVDHIAQQITLAVRWEQDRDDEHSLRWIHRLTRAHGTGQADVLLEWAENGRG